MFKKLKFRTLVEQEVVCKIVDNNGQIKFYIITGLHKNNLIQ